MKAENSAKIQFDSLSANEAFARGAAAAFLARYDPTVPQLADIKTAVSEAVTNCIVHAYPDAIGPVTLSIAVYPERLVKMVDGASGQLYTCAQLVLREYVGRFRLDELLAQKEEIGQYVLQKLRERQEEFCVEVTGAGIKDIILPGEIREIMNTVLVAEKKAQANVIMRREEVASTRSLLNTARLMDENRTLFKLKEMEYLERICDKVGGITLNGGTNVLEQLSELMAAKG